MNLDAGIAIIYRQTDARAQKWEMPEMTSKTEIFRSYYGEKTVGFSRYYTAMQNNDQADLLIEIIRCGKIFATDICTLEPFGTSGAEGTFKITQVQHVLDDDGIAMTDLTLQRLEGAECE